MPKPKTFVGLDIGHSGTKIVATASSSAIAEAVRIDFPSVVVPAVSIFDPNEARRAQADTVELESAPGTKWFVGKTAALQGDARAFTGQGPDWIKTEAHDALIVSALDRLAAAGINARNKGEAVIYMGLPSAEFPRLKDELRDRARRFTQAAIYVAPQPMGAYHDQLLTDDGLVTNGRSLTESWATIDVGHYTADFQLVQEGRWVELASGSCGGVRLAIDELVRKLTADGYPIPPLTAEQVLQDKGLRHFGKIVDVSAQVDASLRLLANEVIETANKLFGSRVSQLDGVIVAGGGGKFIAPLIQSAWPTTVLADDARFAVARGFAKMARATVAVE